MSNRDHIDEQLSQDLRQAIKAGQISLGRALPEPRPDEPTDDQLLLLLDDKLGSSERREVEGRLEHCPYSADRVEILREALEAFQGAERVRLTPDSSEVLVAESRIARLVFSVSDKADRVMRWLRGSDAPVMLDPIGLPTRSSAGVAASDDDHYFKFLRRFGDWDAVIQVESARRGVELRVELHREGVPLDDARAELRRQGKLLESVRVRGGVAGFTDLVVDRYELEIRDGKSDTSIGLLALDFVGDLH